ncbi:MAG: hypothetical protein KatS3mg084_0288 [Candidatus Dojkabacteria bacterium]|nr:MAG: hypothetical protein KatS3mg084_0288 [Candidatus Dojkabacteria bacterium]
MSEIQFIVCPECGTKIPISEALTQQIRQQFENELQKKLEDLNRQKAELSVKLEEKEKSLNEILQRKEKELREKFDQELLDIQKKLKSELEKQARANIELELEDLKRQNQEYLEQLQAAQKVELELRSERRKIEEEKRNIELALARRLDEEREKLIASVQKEFQERIRLQSLEYEKKLSDMQKALEEAQRKATTKSERFVGELQEIDLEQRMREFFPYDEIQEVPKGTMGADIIQIVKDKTGRVYGKIVWESKRTKTFNYDWISKLKDDVIKAQGNFGILVTYTLPDEIQSFDLKDGVWITNFDNCLQLANVLRMNLFEIKRIERLLEGKEAKMSQIYHYLSSDLFRNKIISVLESYKSMQLQLDKEKKAYMKIWAEREMQIKRMTEGTLSILGDMQGIMGNALPKINDIELPYLEE